MFSKKGELVYFVTTGYTMQGVFQYRFRRYTGVIPNFPGEHDLHNVGYKLCICTTDFQVRCNVVEAPDLEVRRTYPVWQVV
jgi:hypothetical protein